MTEDDHEDVIYGKRIAKIEEQKKDAKKPLYLNKRVEKEVIEADYGRSEKPFNLFSPSMVGYCKRQMYNRKFNLTEMPRKIEGILHSGTRNHFWLEHNLPQLFEDRKLRTEQRVKGRIDIPDEEFDVFVSGYADAVDSEGYVYDHKFTSSTYYVQDKPKEKDRRQVLMYIYCLDSVHTGQLEYVGRTGKFEQGDHLRHVINWDEQEFKDTVQRMKEVAKAVEERDGTEQELVNPFDKCEDDCFYCDSEELKSEVKEKLNEIAVEE